MRPLRKGDKLTVIDPRTGDDIDVTVSCLRLHGVSVEVDEEDEFFFVHYNDIVVIKASL